MAPLVPSELQQLISTQETLSSQKNENVMVKEVCRGNDNVRRPLPMPFTPFLSSFFFLCQEFEELTDAAEIYKMVGPVLVKQDIASAKSNVEQRLERISRQL